MTKLSDHYKPVPELAEDPGRKKKKPKLMAVVDEDNCTGCQVCVPFCPVDCIETVPFEKYNIPIPPVQIALMNALAARFALVFVLNLHGMPSE